MLSKLMCAVLIGVGVSAFSGDCAAELKNLEKQAAQKRGELKKLRYSNPAHIFGDEKQPLFLIKRMVNRGESKYYASQVSVVRPYCVCEQSPDYRLLIYIPSVISNARSVVPVFI